MDPPLKRRRCHSALDLLRDLGEDPMARDESPPPTPPPSPPHPPPPPPPTCNRPPIITNDPVVLVKNVDTKNVPPGTVVFLENPRGQVAPKGHPDGALDHVIQILSRRAPTEDDVRDGVSFQLGQIDYVTVPPLPGLPLPRWVDELEDEPRPWPKQPMLVPVLRVFGCTDADLSVVVRVHGFEPYLLCRLPDDVHDLPPMDELRRILDGKVRASVIANGGDQPAWKKKKADESANSPHVVRVEPRSLAPLHGVWDHPLSFLRIATCLPKHVTLLRGVLESTGSLTDDCPPLECYEADVPFLLRFMVDKCITGGDWLRVGPDQWTCMCHDRGTSLERERGGYCARRAEAEERVRMIRAVERARLLVQCGRCGGGEAGCASSLTTYRDTDDRFDSPEERVCDRLWFDYGDPFGEVIERKGGRCSPPWSERRPWWRMRDVLPRFNKCASGEDARCSIEIDVGPDGLVSLGTEGAWAKHAPQRVLSYDTEWIAKGSLFPEVGADPLVCICFGTAHAGDAAPGTMVALQLGECTPVPGAETVWFDDEKTLLMAFRDLVLAYDPDIITGYNTNNFDWPYLLARAKTLGVERRFADMSRIRSEGMRSKRGGASFTSKATARSVDEVDIAGVMIYDMCVAVMAGHKLSSYKLNAVSAHFLGEQKVEVAYDQLPVLQRGTPDDRQRLAVYCTQDARLPLLLAAKLAEFAGAVEMARATHVPVDYLLKRGQQIKVSAQVYALCGPEGVAVESSRRREVSEIEAKYQGATVLRPVCGYYDYPIVTLDFESLYPSIMMGHNLSLDTFLSAEQRERLHPSNYEITPNGNAYVRAPKQFDRATLEGAGLVKDVHYVVAANGRPHLKTPGRITREVAAQLQFEDGADYHAAPDDPSAVDLDCTRKHGILPRILMALIAARKSAKILLATAANPTMKAVYNCRQLSLKVSANSVYGVTGAQHGRLSLPAIAADVTAYGRQMIELTQTITERDFDASVKYGDSVAGNTPVLIRRGGGHAEYVEIRTLAVGDAAPWHGDKEAFAPASLVEIWSDCGWTRVRRVIRHGNTRPLVRVRTSIGYVDVTEDHSLLRADTKECVRPRELCVGRTRLLHADLPRCEPPCTHKTATATSHIWLSGDAIEMANLFLSAACYGNAPIICGSGAFYSIALHGGTDQDVDVISSMVPLSPCPAHAHVYDLETENHHFCAGVGRLVVHNTDSVMADVRIRPPVGHEIVPYIDCPTVRSFVAQKVPPEVDTDATSTQIVERVAAFASTLPCTSDTRGRRAEFYRHADACAGVILDLLRTIGCTDVCLADVVKLIRDVVEIAQINQSAAIGKRICDVVTRQLPAPCRLAFEKTYSRWLLCSKKRYADIRWVEEGGVMKTKRTISSSGLETKRRDSCQLVKRTIEAILAALMLNDDPRGAIAVARAAIRRLLTRACSLDELIITSGYTREEAAYFGRQKHTEVVKKKRARDPATAPRIGERVAYVMVADTKRAKGFERAEDPIYVMKRGCPIDVAYYIDNQLRKPIKRILGAVVPNPDLIFAPRATIDDILAGEIRPRAAGEGVDADAGAEDDSTIVMSVAPPSRDAKSIGRFLVRTGEPCLGCRALVPAHTTADALEGTAPALCVACEPLRETYRAQAAARAATTEAARFAALKKCVECERAVRTSAPAAMPCEVEENWRAASIVCENAECPQFYIRAKAIEIADRARHQLARFDVAAPPPPSPPPIPAARASPQPHQPTLAAFFPPTKRARVASSEKK